MAEAFEFQRTDGGATYRFEPVPGESHIWKRTDLPLWCRRIAGRGWVIVDERELVVGWPRDGGNESDPPSGPWISSKDGRSYEYELRWLV